LVVFCLSSLTPNQLTPPSKNECLLVAKNCINNSSSVQERIDDLKNEISRGLNIYTPDELKLLEDQLQWLENDGVIDLDRS
jgi:hypothetical protein